MAARFKIKSGDSFCLAHQMTFLPFVRFAVHDGFPRKPTQCKMNAMDPITQGLLGAATAQLGFRQKIGRDATLAATVAAIAPDLDIFITPLLSLVGAEVNSMTSAYIHRGLSHSVLMAPLLALPIAWLWWRLRRRNHAWRSETIITNGAELPEPNQADRPPPFGLLYLCVLVAVFTHPLLDWCTSYGTQLLAPISRERFALDCVPIVDLIYTSLLIVTLLTCWLARKFSRGQAIRVTLVIAWVGMLTSVGYLTAGRVMHDWAVQQARIAVAADDLQVLRVDAYPAMGTIFLWRTVVETDRGWRVMRAHRFSDKPVADWRADLVAKADDEWVRRAMELPEVKSYRWFAGGRLRAAHTTRDGLHVIEFHDMRYGWPIESVESLWPVTVIYDTDGQLVQVGRSRHPNMKDRGPIISRAWADIWNP